MDYDLTDQAQRYDAARAMPAEDQRRYLAPLVQYLPEPARLVVDLGCGTGRFSAVLADHFRAPVVGVDPARTMLAKARENVKDPRVTFTEGSADAIPLESGSADLVFVCMAWHHFPDPARAAREIHRVLRNGGLVAVRNSFVDTLEEVDYVHFFPAGKAILAERLPSRDGLRRTLRSAGFECVLHQVFDHHMAPDWEAYCAKVASRAFSDLAAISDADFEAGLAAMRAEHRAGPVVQPIDLFAFVKKGA